MLDMLSTREIAIAIWLGIFILLVLFYKPTRKSAVEVLRAACSVQLVIPFLLMVGYTIGIAYLFSKTTFWRTTFVKEIVIWVIFAGTPLFFGSLNKKVEDHYFKKSVLDCLKITALVEFFISAFTFPLVWEIIIIPLMTVLIMFDAVASTDNQYRPAKKLISVLIGFFSMAFIGETIYVATNTLNELDKRTMLISLLIPIVLSITYVPVAFIFAVFAKYQIVFMRMGFKESKINSHIKLIHRLKVIWSCGLSLRRLEHFERSYIPKIFAKMDETKFESLVRDFRTSLHVDSQSEQNDTERQNIVEEIKEANFHAKIEYINAHIGMFTFLATVFAGLLSVVIKGFTYVFMCGKFDYWGIDHSHINIANENILYEIVLYGALSIVLIALNLIPFTILTSKIKWYVKLLKVSITIIITTVIVALFFAQTAMDSTGITFVSLFSEPIDRLLSFLVNLLKWSATFTLIIYSMGLIMGIMPFKQKGYIYSHIFIHDFFRLATMVWLILLMSMYLIGIYCIGRNLESDQKAFKIVGENFAVIYEDSEHYIISNCEITGEQIIINNSQQKLISKESVETVRKSFKTVKRE